MRGAVGLKGPHLHLPKPLTTELGLAAQRLLCDQRVWSRRTRVDFVLDQVYQLHHVDVSGRDRLVEALPGATIKQDGFAHGGGRPVLLAVQPQDFCVNLLGGHRRRVESDLLG